MHGLLLMTDTVWPYTSAWKDLILTAGDWHGLLVVVDIGGGLIVVAGMTLNCGWQCFILVAGSVLNWCWSCFILVVSSAFN
jgi:hypothetical protein